MGHERVDGLGRVYEWEGGTLVLNPGEFAFDEPHVYMNQDPPGYARATSCMYRPDLQKRSCRSPSKLLALDHGDAPQAVKDKCDTIGVNSGYCCPPYAMPRNWRTDFLPMGQEDVMPGVTDQEYMDEVQIYEADARLAAGKLQEAPEAFTSDAQEVYEYIVKYGNIAATEVGTAATTAAMQVVKATEPAVEDTRTGIRKHPLLAVGFGIVAGAVVARWISNRR
jgi:ElaB/YqjD/DUF883 family membrane-anchored ribosome-binding protein